MKKSNLKNIVVVYDFANNVGGINPVATEPAANLSKNYNVFYCSADERKTEHDSNIQWCSLSTVCNHGSSNAKRAIASIINLKAGWNFLKLLERLNPNETVIHLHGWAMGLSGLIPYIANRKGFKCIYTAHDYSLYCPNGAYFNFKTGSDCFEKPLTFSCISKNCDKRSMFIKAQRVIRGWFEKKIYKVHRCIAHTIYVSNNVKDNIETISITGEEKTVIPNPIKAKQRKKVDYRDNKNLLFVGRVTPEKGIDMLCKVATNMELTLDVCGDGPILNSLKEKYPKVNFHGWLDQEQLDCFYKTARVLVLPSLWRETSGLVVDDAILRGLPVIVSSHTGAEEKIDLNNGFVFEKGSSKSLANKISLICKLEGDINPMLKFSLSYEEYSENVLNIYSEVQNDNKY